MLHPKYPLGQALTKARLLGFFFQIFFFFFNCCYFSLPFWFSQCRSQVELTACRAGVQEGEVPGDGWGTYPPQPGLVPDSARGRGWRRAGVTAQPENRHPLYLQSGPELSGS